MDFLKVVVNVLLQTRIGEVHATKYTKMMLQLLKELFEQNLSKSLSATG